MNFKNIKGDIKLNYNLKHLTWFKVGGNADILFKPENTEDLGVFLKENNGFLPITVIGAGSNIIIRDAGVEGVVVKLGRNFTAIESDINNHSLLCARAGCLNFNLAKFCLENGISGFEFLVGIPGTVGGGIAMNAGAYGSEFKDIVACVEAVDMLGNILNIDVKDIGFGYRHNSLPKDLIFTKVFFNINQRCDAEKIKQKMDEIVSSRFATQPIKEKTGGSTFANQDGYKAWALIDAAGMRGFKVGGAVMSQLHCNFMINLGYGTASDMEELGEIVIEKFKAHSVIV